MQPLVGRRTANEQQPGSAHRWLGSRQPLGESGVKLIGVAKVGAAKYSIHRAATNTAAAAAHLHRSEKQLAAPIALANGAAQGARHRADFCCQAPYGEPTVQLAR